MTHRSAVQTAPQRATRSSAVLTFPIHPGFGSALTVLRHYGPDMVRVEDAEGREWIIPVAWTSLRPRTAPLSHGGVPVHLAPDAVLALAAWVAARRAPTGPELSEFDRQAAAAQRVEHGVSEGHPARRRGRARTDRVVGGAHPARDAGQDADTPRRSR